MKNKDLILDRLYRKDVMRNLHEKTLDGLVRCIEQEYRMEYNFTNLKPYKLEFPVLHAVVNMLTANLMQSFVSDVIEEVIDTIKELEEE